jgi:hypothetical protein
MFCISLVQGVSLCSPTADRPEVWRFLPSMGRQAGGLEVSFPFSSSVQRSGGIEHRRGDGSGRGEDCLDGWMGTEREDETQVSDTIHCPLLTCHITSCAALPLPHTFHLPPPIPCVHIHLFSSSSTVADSLRSCCSLFPFPHSTSALSLRPRFARSLLGASANPSSPGPIRPLVQHARNLRSRPNKRAHRTRPWNP